MIKLLDQINNYFQRDETIRAVLVFAVIYMILQILRAKIHGWI